MHVINMSEEQVFLSFCHENNIDFLKEALINGADPNVSDNRGRSGLHLAASRGAVDALQLLLEAGADPNATDTQGNTPLHMCGHIETVQCLFEFSARINTRNKHGDTPIVLMHRRGVSPEVLQQMELYAREEQEDNAPLLQQRMRRCSGRPRTMDHVRTLWYEFCNDLGVERLALVLLLVLLLSLYVAYSITGYSKTFDTRIPLNMTGGRIEL